VVTAGRVKGKGRRCSADGPLGVLVPNPLSQLLVSGEERREEKKKKKEKKEKEKKKPAQEAWMKWEGWRECKAREHSLM